jgi:hypothetical protein
MKLGRFLCAAMLVATAVSVATFVAKADGVDPRVIVNRGDPDPVNYNGIGPIVKAFDPAGFSLDFIYTGTRPLNSLLFLLTGAPIADTYQCLSDVWAHCIFGPVPSLGDAEEDFGDFDHDSSKTATFAFLFFGAGPCQSDGGVGGECSGSLQKGDTFGVTVDTPEPSTILLLFAGMLPVFLLTRKRWAVHRLSN